MVFTCRCFYYFKVFGFIFISNPDIIQVIKSYNISADPNELWNENLARLNGFQLACIVTYVCEGAQSGTDSDVTIAFKFRDGTICRTNVNI